MQARVTHVLALSERPGKLVWAGAERHLRLLLPALARAGVDVEAIVLATAPGPVVAEGLAEWRRAGVGVTLLARRARASRLRSVPAVLWQHCRLWGALRRRRRRIVHLHLDLLAMPCAAAAAGCPHVVVTLHNEVLLPRAAWAAVLLRVWLGWLGRRVTRFVAISERVRAHFVALVAGTAGKVDVVEYGYELAAARPPTRAALGWPADAFLVGFVGRLVFEKNPLVLVDAMAAHRDMHLVMVGDGPLRPDVERLIAARGLANVHLAGAIESAGRLVPLFDVLCLPSRWEGLGLVLVEAMLQGVPVVGSRRGAVPDILGDGAYGLLFDPDRGDELAAALAAVRRDRAAARRRAWAAAAYAADRFSVAAMVARTRRVYERAAPPPAALAGACGRVRRAAT